MYIVMTPFTGGAAVIVPHHVPQNQVFYMNTPYFLLTPIVMVLGLVLTPMSQVNIQTILGSECFVRGTPVI